MTDQREAAAPLRDLDEVFADFVAGDWSATPSAIYDGLSPYASLSNHRLMGWVWYNLALSCYRLDRQSLFLKYAEQFCFSDITWGFEYRSAKLYVLRLRIPLLKAQGLDALEELDLLTSLGPGPSEFEMLKNLGISTAPQSMLFSADQTIGAFEITPKVRKAKALTAEHYSVRDALNDITEISPSISIVKNCEYLSIGDDCGLTRNGMWFGGLWNTSTLKSAYDDIKALQKLPANLGGTAIVLNDTFSGDNYCHWMLDWCARVLIAQTKFNKIDWICCRISRKGFQEEFLRLIGIKPLSILIDEGVRWWKFDQVLLVDNEKIALTHPAWSANEHVVALVRNAVMSKLPDRPSKRSRIYISRSDVGRKRSIINEVEVVNVLKRFGFDVLTLSPMTLLEQAEIFSNCEVVVAVHGAGLTNVLFMPQKSVVIEMFHYRFGSQAYCKLANSLDIDYRYLTCGAEDLISKNLSPIVIHSEKFIDESIYVDVGALEKELDNIFGISDE